MTRHILVPLALLLASPALAQETLPLRDGLGRVQISLRDGEGGYLVGTSILLSGPTQRQALTLGHGAAEFKDLPPGTYRVAIRTDGTPETHHTLTIVGGVRYAALWTVGDWRLPLPVVAPPVSTLGPLSISKVKLESKRDVTYVASNRSHFLMYCRVEIRRTYADGSSRVDFQQDDSFDRNALASLRIPAFYLSDSWSPVHYTGTNLHPARFTGRADPPVWAQVRIVAIATTDGVTLGDASRLRRLIDRRRVMVEELEYWIGRFEAHMREAGGVLLIDMLAEELAIARPGERTPDYRSALFDTLTNLRRAGVSDTAANSVVLGHMKNLIKYHDYAVDQLMVLQLP